MITRSIMQKYHTRQDNSYLRLVDVGGSGFRAVALWMLDYLLEIHFSSQLMNQFWIHKIQERHLFYFPIHQSAFDALTDVNQVKKQQLSDRLKREMIDTLAYTLGRIAFDEICAQPVCYRSVFLHQPVERLHDFMHKFLPEPDRCGIAALAKALKLCITIQEVNALHDIYATYRYGDNQFFGPVLRLRMATYFMPLVADRAWEKSINHHIHTAIKPTIDKINEGMTLAQLRAELALADDKLCSEFNHVKVNLETMLRAGDLSLASLKALYCTTKQAASQSVIVGREFDNQSYFDTITCLKKQTSSFVSKYQGYDNELAQKLICAIARAISLGDMSWDLIDSYL